MKLTRLEVRNHRSIFERSSTDGGLRLDLAEGLNVLVGRNNCGKSNLFRALALALDANYEFDPTADIPGPLNYRYPSVQLWFSCDPNVSDEGALLRAANDYEQLATESGFTRAAADQVVLRVSYAPDDKGTFERRERLVFLDGSDEARSPSAESMLEAVIDQLRALVRFVMVSSGESIESVLEGSFREILHTVVQDRMGAQFSAAEDHRQEYIRGLQAELLGPLRDIVAEVVHRLFPEISSIDLTPDVSDIESTLARVAIGLNDAVSTPLAQKGTGVRGGVLVAMLRYLAENTDRCVVFAVEEPEAFLHPAAQEDLRTDLEALAERPDATVLVTSHSPFIVSRNSDALTVLLDKDHEGRTRIAAASQGNDSKVTVISGLVREESLEDILATTAAIGSDKAALLMVEGYGDKAYIEMAAAKLGRPGLISDLEIIPSGGTTRMVYQACVAVASTKLPVGVLLDNDLPGRNARDYLLKLQAPGEKQKLFQKNKNLFGYSMIFGGLDFDWEAEDLFPPEIIQRFVDDNGGPYSPVCKGMSGRPDGGYHFDLNEDGKTALGAFLTQQLQVEDLSRWGELLEKIRAALGLPEEAEPAPEVEPANTGNQSVPKPGSGKLSTTEADERVLVVSQNYGHAEYIRSNVFAGEPGRGLSPDIRYVAFYEKGVIRPEIPRVLARHDDLVFSEDLIAQLSKSSNSADQQLAAFMTEELETGRRAPGDVRQIFLLSAPDDDRTIVLPHSVDNTKLSPKGKPMAWVVLHKLAWKSAFLQGAQTTDELDAYEESKTP